MNRTGFVQTNDKLLIDKDVEAQLAYTFDWSEWLEDGDTILTATYDIAARRNDPLPLVKVDEGVTPDGLFSYVELSDGQVNKGYTVSCTITTTNGLTDARNFQVNVKNRSA